MTSNTPVLLQALGRLFDDNHDLVFWHDADVEFQACVRLIEKAKTDPVISGDITS